MGVKPSLITIKEEHTVFKNRVLMRICRHERDEVTGGWRKSYSVLLFTKYYYGDQIKENGMGRACSMYAEMRNMRNPIFVPGRSLN